MNLKKLTDTSPMPFGKHKGTAMANVPASYLLWLYAQNNLTDVYVKEYIQDNLDLLHAEAKKEITPTNPNS